MDFYTRTQDTAFKLLSSKGKTVTVTQKSAGVFDPVAGSYTTPQTETTSTPKAVLLPLRRIEDNRYVAELVQGKLREFLIEAKSMSFEIKAGDSITDGADTLEVLGCTPLNPAGTTIVYKGKARVV